MNNVSVAQKMQNNKARSFVAIMIIIAIFALLVRNAVLQIISFSIVQNESDALATLKLISAALENYANDHQDSYPADVSFLLQTTPPYLDRDYIQESPVKGYAFSCSRLESTSYSCSAVPVKCGLTGEKTFTVATAGALVVEDCSKKE